MKNYQVTQNECPNMRKEHTFWAKLKWFETTENSRMLYLGKQDLNVITLHSDARLQK